VFVRRDIPTCESNQSCLTHVARDQRFHVWLCAMNCSKNELLIIRTIRWSQTIEIEVKPTRCRGSRARLISPSEPDQPIFLKRNLLIPSCALQGPSVSSLIHLSTRESRLGRCPGEQCSTARLATRERTARSCRSSQASRHQYAEVSPR
jgi:hypothetical protein